MVKQTSELLGVSVNGEHRLIPQGLNIRTLLQHLGIAPDRVAVELNRQIVRQPAWDTATIDSGAEIEIVQFVGGG